VSWKKNVFRFYTDNLFSEVSFDDTIIGPNENGVFESKNITIGKWLTLEEFIDGDMELMKEAIKYNPSCIKFLFNPPQEIVDYHKNRLFQMKILSERFTDQIIGMLETHYEPIGLKCNAIKNEFSSYLNECVQNGKVSSRFKTEMHNHVEKIVKSIDQTTNWYQAHEIEKSFCKLFNRAIKGIEYFDTNPVSMYR
jgi:hypothetical protein